MKRIREKMRIVQNSTEKVEQNLPETFEEFKSMDLEKDGVYKRIETAIQACYDICALIVKRENLEIPGNEESIVDLPTDEGIISNEVGGKLKDMKGFRNALAHKYGSIDDKQAYENISHGFEDFNAFLGEIDDYLD